MEIMTTSYFSNIRAPGKFFSTSRSGPKYLSLIISLMPNTARFIQALGHYAPMDSQIVLTTGD